LALANPKTTKTESDAAMSKFCILTPDAQYADDAIVERQTAGDAAIWSIFREGHQTRELLPDKALRDADALLVWHEMIIDEEFIARIPNCRVIVRAGVGFDHIDLAAAGRAGIPVCNTPDYGTSEVADHAIALMLSLTRGIVSYHDAIKRDPIAGFDSTIAPLLRRIRNTVFGIVGLGRIGTAAALRAKGFGMNVVAYDPYLPRGAEIALGVERVESLSDLLRQSDIVSLHCPLTSETRELINQDTLSEMQAHAILINTARGGVIDIPALIRALKDNTIAGAGIDVLPMEPPSKGDEISRVYANFENSELDGRLIVTPHAAWASPESRADARRLSTETMMLYLQTGELRNLVNKSHLRAERR
jgi:phosphoglycerate dehydrogenase-like enzyme